MNKLVRPTLLLYNERESFHNASPAQPRSWLWRLKFILLCALWPVRREVGRRFLFQMRTAAALGRNAHLAKSFANYFGYKSVANIWTFSDIATQHRDASPDRGGATLW